MMLFFVLSFVFSHPTLEDLQQQLLQRKESLKKAPYTQSEGFLKLSLEHSYKENELLDNYAQVLSKKRPKLLGAIQENQLVKTKVEKLFSDSNKLEKDNPGAFTFYNAGPASIYALFDIYEMFYKAYYKITAQCDTPMKVLRPLKSAFEFTEERYSNQWNPSLADWKEVSPLTASSLCSKYKRKYGPDESEYFVDRTLSVNFSPIGNLTSDMSSSFDIYLFAQSPYNRSSNSFSFTVEKIQSFFKELGLSLDKKYIEENYEKNIFSSHTIKERGGYMAQIFLPIEEAYTIGQTQTIYQFEPELNKVSSPQIYDTSAYMAVAHGRSYSDGYVFQKFPALSQLGNDVYNSIRLQRDPELYQKAQLNNNLFEGFQARYIPHKPAPFHIHASDFDQEKPYKEALELQISKDIATLLSEKPQEDIEKHLFSPKDFIHP